MIEIIFVKWPMYWCWFLTEINASTCTCFVYNRFGAYSWSKYSWWIICGSHPFNITDLILFIIEILICSPPRDHDSIRIIVYTFSEYDHSNQFPLLSSATETFSVFFKHTFVMKITIASSCEDSSMLTSSIIDVERNYNSSFNVIL